MLSTRSLPLRPDLGSASACCRALVVTSMNEYPPPELLRVVAVVIEVPKVIFCAVPDEMCRSWSCPRLRAQKLSVAVDANAEDALINLAHALYRQENVVAVRVAVRRRADDAWRGLVIAVIVLVAAMALCIAIATWDHFLAAAISKTPGHTAALGALATVK